MMTAATCTNDHGRPSCSIMCYPIVQDIDLKAKKVSPARRLFVRTPNAARPLSVDVHQAAAAAAAASSRRVTIDCFDAQ